MYFTPVSSFCPYKNGPDVKKSKWDQNSDLSAFTGEADRTNFSSLEIFAFAGTKVNEKK